MNFAKHDSLALASLCLMMLFSAGCGETKREADQITSSLQLRGDYDSDCKKTSTLVSVGTALFAEKVRATRKNITVSGDSMNSTRTIYSDENCAQALGHFTYEGEYRAGEAIANDPGARAIDIIIKKATFTVTTQDAVKTANDIKLCGIEGWALNASLDVSGRDCLFFSVPKNETTHYTAYKLDNGVLSMGDYDCSEGDRDCKTLSSSENAAPKRDTDLKIAYKKR